VVSDLVRGSEGREMKRKLTIPQPAIIVGRRPIMSARSPAMIAPKKVPADKIETMREVWEELMASAFPAIERMNSLDESTPLMYPESYPKKIPPNEAKAHLKEETKKEWGGSADASSLRKKQFEKRETSDATHIMYALKVTGASMRLTSSVFLSLARPASRT